mmetsp:Transcript_12256/g.44702  ORF Transcript_12256/g.44702 Transcript_12256/m.44702 type:complete len:262 (+) Transcript_12256:44-829(+)
MRDRRLQLDIRLCLLLVCPLVAWSAAAQHARPAANMSDSEFLQHMGDLVSKLHLVKVQPEQGSVGHTLGTANCAKYSGFDNLNNLKAMPHINVDVDVRRHHTYREVVDLLVLFTQLSSYLCAQLSVTWPREKHRMKWSDYFHFRVERTGGTTTANLEATVHSGPGQSQQSFMQIDVGRRGGSFLQQFDVARNVTEEGYPFTWNIRYTGKGSRSFYNEPDLQGLLSPTVGSIRVAVRPSMQVQRVAGERRQPAIEAIDDCRT